jgi:hypothetical protein
MFHSVEIVMATMKVVNVVKDMNVAAVIASNMMTIKK